MITYILTVMSLHCSLAYQAQGNANQTEPRYDCNPQVAFIEFTGKTEDEAKLACDRHMVETVRLMGKYSYKAALSCKRKGTR